MVTRSVPSRKIVVPFCRHLVSLLSERLRYSHGAGISARSGVYIVYTQTRNVFIVTNSQTSIFCGVGGVLDRSYY